MNIGVLNPAMEDIGISKVSFTQSRTMKRCYLFVFIYLACLRPGFAGITLPRDASISSSVDSSRNTAITLPSVHHHHNYEPNVDGRMQTAFETISKDSNNILHSEFVETSLFTGRSVIIILNYRKRKLLIIYFFVCTGTKINGENKAS